MEELLNNPTWWSLGVVCLIGFALGFIINLRWRNWGLVSIFFLMLTVALIQIFMFGDIPHSFIMNLEETINVKALPCIELKFIRSYNLLEISFFHSWAFPLVLSLR